MEENAFMSLEDTLKDKYLTFEVCSEMYGIEIQFVTEIIGIEAITEMPEMPDYFKGIINLRGRIIPVMDIRLRFGKEGQEYNDRTCIIVIRHSEISIGLIVDSVSEVISITGDNIIKLTKTNMGIENRFIKDIGKIDDEVVLMIDCESLLTFDELFELKEAYSNVEREI